MTMSTKDQLSFRNFDPTTSQPPYLNSPRSLEACKIHGISPSDLLQFTIEDYKRQQSDFPRNTIAAKAVYELLDGARRQDLQIVINEYRNLCDKGWPENDGVNNKNQQSMTFQTESIIDVPPEAHSTLLEIHATQFRKIESDEWRGFQQLLLTEMIKAKENVKAKEKNEAMRKKFGGNWRADQEKKEYVMKQKADRKKDDDRIEKEKLDLANLRILQKKDVEAANLLAKEAADKAAYDRTVRRNISQERLKHEEGQAQARDLKVKALEALVEEGRTALANKHQESLERRMDALEIKKQNDKEKSMMFKERVLKAKQTVHENSLMKREKLVQLIQLDEAAHADRIKQLETQRMQKISDDNLLDRVQEIKKRKEQAEDEYIAKSRAALEAKEKIAKEERGRLNEEQEVKRIIASYRHEVVEMQAQRIKKAEEYALNQKKEKIKIQNKKFAAVKKGSQTLKYMRTTLQEIVHQTSLYLQEEIEQLHKHDKFTPDKVMERAIAVSDKVLFPRLEANFGDNEKTRTLGSINQPPPENSSTTTSTSNKNLKEHLVSATLPIQQITKANLLATLKEGTKGHTNNKHQSTTGAIFNNKIDPEREKCLRISEMLGTIANADGSSGYDYDVEYIFGNPKINEPPQSPQPWY